MPRYETDVEDGTIYIQTGDGRLAVGPVADAVDIVGGPAWTITYPPEVTQRHPGLDTADEGLTVDVVDIIHAMTHSERFVETLAAQPADPASGEEISPRLGLFVGKLLENLESGVS
jgi:hypothetical protein